MKKSIVFILLMSFGLMFVPVQSQTAQVARTETERLVDKYLEKAGNVIDSTFSKVAPMAEKAFSCYTQGYKMKGTINFYLYIFLPIFFLLLFIIFCVCNVILKDDEWDGATMWNISASVSITLFAFALFISIFSITDAYTMMKAPEYWVLKDLLGK
jgi:hypothetical protein